MLSAYSMAELNAEIKKQKRKKAQGIYGSPNDVIKTLRFIASQKLLLIINPAWNIGQFQTNEDRQLSPNWKEPERQNQEIQISVSQSYQLSGQVDGKNDEYKTAETPETPAHQRTVILQKEPHHRRSADLMYLAKKVEFQKKKMKMKALAAFVDPTKAFNNVWKEAAQEESGT